MYTAVLMIALTTSVESVDFGRRGGGGGACSGYGGYGGGYGGCGGGYGSGGGYGCCGGGYYGSGGYRTSYYGGGYYGTPTYGMGYYPSTPFYSSGGSYFAPNVIVQTPATNVRQSFYMDPNAANVASMRVLVPNASAQIWFDGAATTQTGTERIFVSPTLTPGSKYYYTVKARWNDNGQTINRERRVEVQPGQSMTTVDFRNEPSENVPAPKANTPKKNDA
jgi:uncharacterized protein (TIGR03000 family)